MKKVKFTVSTNRVGSQITEIVEFEDDTTEAEIEECYKQWVWENIDGMWELI